MKLSCNATTPQELREEIVTLILHRAAQQNSIASIVSKSIAYRMEHQHAARTLERLAEELKNMELVHAWPAGLREEGE